MLSKDSRGGILSWSRLPRQLKVPVGRNRILAQRDVPPTIGFRNDENRVRCRFQFPERKSWRQIHRETDRVDRPIGRLFERRGHARGVRHAIRIQRHALTGLCLILDEDWGAGDIAGTDDHGEAE